MKLEIYKPLWGHEGSLSLAVEQAVEAGFQGIEGSAPLDALERATFKAELEENNLSYIGEIFTGGNYVPDAKATPEDHLDDIKRGLERLLPLNPQFINTQAGLDAWSMKTKVEFCEEVMKLAEEYKTTISIETHRSRMTYSPWVTKDLIDALPTLPLTIDFSHWCCVTERLIMNDEPELLVQIAQQTHHIHARVGYDQGPQVPDPRAPEYASDVEAHLSWWKEIWAAMESKGKERVTMTPEFGTDGYLHLEPYTTKPVADLWEVNKWMGRELREHWHYHC